MTTNDPNMITTDQILRTGAVKGQAHTNAHRQAITNRDARDARVAATRTR